MNNCDNGKIEGKFVMEEGDDIKPYQPDCCEYMYMLWPGSFECARPGTFFRDRILF